MSSYNSKIIFLNRFFYPDHSATSQLLTDLVFFLENEGNDIHVITSRQRYDDAKANLSALEIINGVQVHRVWTTCFGRDWLFGRALDYVTYYLSVGWRLLWFMSRGDVVVAKTDPPLISIIAAVVAKLRGGVLVNWVQDLFPEVASVLGVRGLNGSAASLLRRLRNASLAAATMNVVLGERMADRLRGEGISDSRIQIIHNWADGEAIQPIPLAENSLRQEWRLEEKFVVGYSGNMGRVHEFSTMIDVAQSLHSEQDIIFLFIGDGPQRQRLVDEVRQRGLDKVRFSPYQPREALGNSLSVPDVHLISLLPGMEGLIVPSKFYGIAAAGRPVLFVGDPDGELASIIREEECGFVVAPGQGAILADSIRQLAAQPDRCQQMGVRARKVFERKFDKKIALAQWRNVLATVRTRL